MRYLNPSLRVSGKDLTCHIEKFSIRSRPEDDHISNMSLFISGFFVLHYVRVQHELLLLRQLNGRNIVTAMIPIILRRWVGMGMWWVCLISFFGRGGRGDENPNSNGYY